MVKRHIVFALLATLLIPVSCTVKEDRVPCPAYLNVSFLDRENILGKVGLLGWDQSEMFRESIDVADYDPYWVKAVHKEVFWFAAWEGNRDALVAGRYVTIAPGNQCDSLYAYFQVVDATVDEMTYAEVAFKKQFATVRVDILKSAAEMRSYDFFVRGNTNGFDMLTFEPVPGAFSFVPSPAAGARVIEFRLPRQSDNSVALTIWREGLPIGDFPLGEYIARTGYRWDTEELQDIYVVIDLVVGQITINVEGWEEGAVFTYVEQ